MVALLPIGAEFRGLRRCLYNFTLSGRNMKITRKGQVTIPREIRERLGLRPNTELRWNSNSRAIMFSFAKRALCADISRSNYCGTPAIFA